MKKILNNTIKMRHTLSLIFNLAIVVLTWYAVNSMLFGNENGNMTNGVETFRYFTNLSNIFASMVAMFVIPFNINSIASGKGELPLWVTICKYTGTVAVSVTLVTVVLFLGPRMGWTMMFKGPCLYLHLINPLLAIASTVFFETDRKMPILSSFIGMAPMAVYSIIYLVNVAFTGVWPDFYGFTFGGKMWMAPISLVAMYVVTYLIALGLQQAQSRFGCRLK